MDIPSDIRTYAVDDYTVWRDGRCTQCGTQTYGADARQAPMEAMTPEETRGLCDYYIWCANTACENYAEECVNDLSCPPEWGTHDRD